MHGLDNIDSFVILCNSKEKIEKLSAESCVFTGFKYVILSDAMFQHLNIRIRTCSGLLSSENRYFLRAIRQW